MIRLVTYMRRKDGLELAEFQERMRAEYGPVVAAHQTVLGIQRHVQTHRLAVMPTRPKDDLRGELEEPYDAVSEFWFNSLPAITRALASEGGSNAYDALLNLESDLVDLAASPLWFAYEYPQFTHSPEGYVARPNSPLVKNHFVIRQLPGQTDSEALFHWHTNHGAFARWAAPSLDMLAYSQVHRYETRLETELRERRGVRVDPYLGHAETWQNGSAAPPTGAEYARIRSLVIQDELRFIDFSRSSRVIGNEFVFVDQLAPGPGGFGS